MTPTEVEMFEGPYLPPNYMFWGLALVAGFGGLSVATLSVAPWLLLMTLPLMGLGARLLYLSVTRTPIQVIYYTLTPEGLRYAPPQEGAQAQLVPWGAIRRLETTVPPPRSLRLHFFAGNVTPDPVPKLGHKVNEMLLGNTYRRWRTDQAFEPVAQALDLDPSLPNSDGATFGERLPIWFARYATAAQA